VYTDPPPPGCPSLQECKEALEEEERGRLPNGLNAGGPVAGYLPGCPSKPDRPRNGPTPRLPTGGVPG
jgi:hypothetical protein